MSTPSAPELYVDIDRLGAHDVGMTPTRTENLAAAKWRRAAEESFRRANPDANHITFTWLRLSSPCPYADGSPGAFRTGRVRIAAPGYEPRIMNASGDANGTGMMVR
jgi:hypothetical protein